MKLAEKFRNMVLYNDIADWEKECVNIADEYAINFANWYEFTLRESDNLNERFTPKQLIEMFKIEKRL